MNTKNTKGTEGVKVDFLESVIKVLHQKSIRHNSDLKEKMKCLAQVCRRVIYHYTEVFEDFAPVALLFEPGGKIYILSKDKVKKEIEVGGFSEFIKLYPGITPPKIFHLSEINKIEKMLTKEEKDEK